MFWRLGANATPGARNLSVDGLTLVNAFAVNPGNAVILSIAPNTGQQGQTLNITVTGQFTNLRNTSIAGLGNGAEPPWAMVGNALRESW